MGNGCPQYVVLMANDTDKTRLSEPSAFSVAQECLRQGVWAFKASGKLRTSLDKGDKVLIFVGGRRDSNQTFVASAEIGGASSPEPVKILAYSWPYRVTLTKIRWFPKLVPMRPLLSKLQFIKNPRNWGIHFYGGAARITESDYEMILAKGFKNSRARK